MCLFRLLFKTRFLDQALTKFGGFFRPKKSTATISISVLESNGQLLWFSRNENTSGVAILKQGS